MDLCTSDTLWGLSNRCVAFESVALISDVLKMVKPSLVSLTTTAKDGPSKEVRHVSILCQLIVSFFDSFATGFWLPKPTRFYVLLSIRGRQARSSFFFVCSLYISPIFNQKLASRFLMRDVTTFTVERSRTYFTCACLHLSAT